MAINANILESVELENGTTLYVQMVGRSAYLTTNAQHLEIITQLTLAELVDLKNTIAKVEKQYEQL